MDQDITLKLSTVNAILNYLGSRPYADVFQLIHQIQGHVMPQLGGPSQQPVPPSAEPSRQPATQTP